MQDQSQEVPYEIVHATLGRIRLRIPQLKSSQEYADRLQQAIASHVGVTEVRLNAAASSVVVTYRPRVISAEAMQAQLYQDIQQTGAKSFTTSATAKSIPEKPTQVQSLETAVAQSEPQVDQPPGRSPLKPESLHPKSTEPEIPEDTSEAEPVPPLLQPDPEKRLAPESNSGLEQPASIDSSAGAAPQPATSAQTTRCSQRTLAKRLQVSSSKLKQQRTQPDFSGWSAAQDPEGKGWQYDAQTGYFYPAASGEVAQ